MIITIETIHIIKEFNELYNDVPTIAFSYVYESFTIILNSPKKWDLLDLVYYSDNMHSSFLDKYMFYRLVIYGFTSISSFLNFKYGINILYKLANQVYINPRYQPHCRVIDDRYRLFEKSFTPDETEYIFIYFTHKLLYILPSLLNIRYLKYTTELDLVKEVALYLTEQYFLGTLCNETMFFLNELSF